MPGFMEGRSRLSQLSKIVGRVAPGGSGRGFGISRGLFGFYAKVIIFNFFPPRSRAPSGVGVELLFEQKLRSPDRGGAAWIESV